MATPTSIYRDPAARQRMLRYYDRFLERLPPPEDRTTVETLHGSTHVLIYGPADAPPVLCLHGALAGAPHALYEIRELLPHYRVFTPDIVGQSVASSEVRPSFGKSGYASWARDIMAGLGVERAHVLGVSWGGAIALQVAVHEAQLIDRLALLVPAGLVAGSSWRALIEAGWPMMRWKLRPTQQNLERVLRATFTTLDPLWTEFMGDVFRSMKIDFKPPPLVTAMELREFDRPTMVIAAQHDLSFPAKPMMKRAPEVLRNLVQTHVIAGSRHCPPFEEDFRGWLCDVVRDFLDRPMD